MMRTLDPCSSVLVCVKGFAMDEVKRQVAGRKHPCYQTGESIRRIHYPGSLCSPRSNFSWSSWQFSLRACARVSGFVTSRNSVRKKLDCAKWKDSFLQEGSTYRPL